MDHKRINCVGERWVE